MASNVAEFYKNKNIFITGGTGFLGVALIDKLLRACPDVKAIYLLMRPKKGKATEERLEELTKNTIFETLLANTTKDIFKKLIPIAGDVGEENLGISPSDRTILIDNINVVIHSAATLDFQAALKPTVEINILGTRRVVQLCSQIKNLNCLVHVSSAYVNSFILNTEEKLYPAPDDVKKVIEMVQTLSEEVLEQKTQSLLKEHPNTYTFTKHLAEHEVNNVAERFPCGIVRPSMIVAAWKEPVPGWTNSKNGPQGFLMGASKGVVRRLPVNENLVYDYIPVDVVVNQLLVTGYHVSKIKSKELTIFHCTSSTYNPFKWDLITDKINSILHKYPLKSAVWYPHLKFLSSLWLFKLSAIFVHFIPAYILDFVTKMAGGRPILVRLHTNVWNSLKLLEKFIFTEWKFDNTKTIELSRTLSVADTKTFNIDIKELIWLDFFDDMAQGVRRYLNNEKPKNLPAARKKDTMLLGLHLTLQAAVYSGLWWLASCLLGTTMTKCGLLVPVFYILFSFLTSTDFKKIIYNLSLLSKESSNSNFDLKSSVICMYLLDPMMCWDIIYADD